MEQLFLNGELRIYYLYPAIVGVYLINYLYFLLLKQKDFLVETLLGSVDVVFQQENMSLLLFNVHALFLRYHILGTRLKHIDSQFLIGFVYLGLGLAVLGLLGSGLF